MSDFVLGFAACIVAAVLFGCMFVPLKRIDPGDGIFAQWVMCGAVFVVGLLINVIRHSPTFYPLAMVGGALWALGNATAVPIIQVIGMGLGIMIWSTTCLLAGWASGRYGWFGTSAQVPRNELTNYFGVALSVLGGFMFLFVKSTGRSSAGDVPSKGPESALHSENDVIAEASDESDAEDTKVSVSSVAGSDSNPLMKPRRGRSRLPLSPNAKRLIGLITALIAGVFYGLTFVPVVYIQDHRNDSSHFPDYVTASDNGLDYVFSHYSGIFLTSTAVMLLYCGVKKNRPLVIPEIILPAYISGTMWAVAQAAFFVANDSLEEAVSFPIITRLPGVIAALWGVFVFKEIRGRQNLSMLLVASLVTIVAGVISGLSNVQLSWLK